MNVKVVIKSIRALVESLLHADKQEKVKTYATIKILLKDIEEINPTDREIIPNFETYSKELLSHCRSLAGLNDGNGHDETLHLSWAYRAINNLESYHCLNINNMEPLYS